MEHTGIVVAYMGSEAPTGWLLCNGFDIPEGEKFDTLRTMIGGNKLPDFSKRPVESHVSETEMCHTMTRHADGTIEHSPKAEHSAQYIIKI